LRGSRRKILPRPMANMEHPDGPARVVNCVNDAINIRHVAIEQLSEIGILRNHGAS